jgi:hypothetical protein
MSLRSPLAALTKPPTPWLFKLAKPWLKKFFNLPRLFDKPEWRTDG